MLLRDIDRHRLVAIPLIVLSATMIVSTAPAADFASQGAQGTLIVKVKATGGAKHKAGSGAGLEAREWKIDNTAQFSIRLHAIGVVGDTSPENQAKGEAARDAFQQTVTDKEQSAMEFMEKKMETCQGNEACEMRVLEQMAGSPGFQNMMQRMQGGASAMIGAARDVDLAPSQQVWMSDPMDPSPASGRLRLNLVESAFGVIDTGGGGKVDVTCRWQGMHQIAPGTPESKVGASVRIDTKASRYEVRIPAEAFSLRLTESCSDSKAGAHGPSKNKKDISLIGRSPSRGVKNFAELLTFKGTVGATGSPQLSGKETVRTDWISANNPQAIPVTVLIEWQFSAGGR